MLLLTRRDAMDVTERTVRDARRWFLDKAPVLDTRTPLQKGMDTVRARVEDAREDVFEQDRSFWIAFSFGIGLAVAGVVTFFWWRRRFQQQEDEHLIQLPGDQTDLSESAEVGGTIVAVGSTILENAQQDDNSGSEDEQEDGNVADALVADALANAAFVGVIETKRYYPLETPLDQLTTENGEAADVVYFTSEDDAQAQGYVFISGE
jgi:hypothetical protein